MGARDQINLCDHNFWLALVLPPHVHHEAARAFWDGLRGDRAVFCRTAQQGFLRLLTTEAVLAPYGLPARTQSEAWGIYHGVMADPSAGFLTEPAGVEPLWEELSSRSSASPKLWVVAYLAALVIRGGCFLATFDRAFQRFEPQRLRLKCLGIP